MDKLAPYSKLIVAVVTALLTIASQFLPTDVMQVTATVVWTILGAFGVYRVPNAPVPPKPPASGSQYRSPALIGIVAVLIAGWLLVMQGCAGNAVRIAETPEQRAYAVLGTYEATLATANDLLSPESPVPVAIQRRIHDAGMPVVRAARLRLRPTYTLYLDLQRQHQNGDQSLAARIEGTLPLLIDYTSEVLDLMPKWQQAIRIGEAAR